MPEIKINLDPDTHAKLKAYAKEDDRSLTKYISRGLIYLSNNPYHRNNFNNPYLTSNLTSNLTSGIVSVSNVNNNNNNMNDMPLTLDALQQQGVTGIKLMKPVQSSRNAQITPEEEELKQQKINLQLSKIKEQRIKFISQKAKEILGYDLTYLEQKNAEEQKITDLVLDKYKTNEEVLAWLAEIKKEDEEYFAEEEKRKAEEAAEIAREEASHSKEYLTIRDYFKTHCEAYEFDDMVQNARAGDLQYIKDYYDISLHDALGSPHLYEFSDDQWSEIMRIITE